MNDLEKLGLKRIMDISDEAFTALALLPLNASNFNFNDHILPISSMLGKIHELAKAIRDNSK